MNNEVLGGIVSKITHDHFLDRVLDIIVAAWNDGDIQPHDVVERGDCRDLIFDINGEMYKINVMLDSYGDAYRRSSLEGPLKAVEKTMTVYE